MYRVISNHDNKPLWAAFSQQCEHCDFRVNLDTTTAEGVLGSTESLNGSKVRKSEARAGPAKRSGAGRRSLSDVAAAQGLDGVWFWDLLVVPRLPSR